MPDDKRKTDSKVSTENPEAYLLETDIYSLERPEKQRQPAALPQPNKKKNSTNTETLWNVLFTRHRPLEKETSLFILVSALDVYMTWMILKHSDIYVESNPLARFFINHWGPRGMIYFKFSMVAFVCIVTQTIAIKKIETARRVLQFAIIVVAGVVIYSLSLLLRFG